MTRRSPATTNSAQHHQGPADIEAPGGLGTRRAEEAAAHYGKDRHGQVDQEDGPPAPTEAVGSHKESSERLAHYGGQPEGGAVDA